MADQQDMKIMVLIADDDTDTREILKIALNLHNYTIIEVADGRRMIELAKKEKPDLIVADIMMPFIDGYEAVKILREDPFFQTVPVLFISCIITRGTTVDNLKKMPLCAFLEKPFDHIAFLSAIDNLIQKKKNLP